MQIGSSASLGCCLTCQTPGYQEPCGSYSHTFKTPCGSSRVSKVTNDKEVLKYSLAQNPKAKETHMSFASSCLFCGTCPLSQGFQHVGFGSESNRSNKGWEYIKLIKIKKLLGPDGPDGFHTRRLKELKCEIVGQLIKICNLSFQSASIPDDWNTANVTTIFQKKRRGESRILWTG